MQDTERLFFKVKEVFPAAEVRWAGAPDWNSAVVEWMDGHFVATVAETYDDEMIYMVGLYPPKRWTEGTPSDAPVAFVDIDGVDNVVAYLDTITEIQPEGTDFWAWAEQWTKDAVCDHRISGARFGGEVT